MASLPYIRSFKASTNLITKLGEANAYLIWAMGLYLEEPDLEALASEGLTDGNDDKKIDFIYLDRDIRKLVFAQGYYSTAAKSNKDVAPANKASDLNTASAWLFSGDIATVPKELREAISEFRDAYEAGEIEQIELLYVHNLPESINVERELKTAAAYVKKAVGDDSSLTISSRELGSSILQNLFASQESHIEVRELISLTANNIIKQNGPNWEALVLSVPGKWLHDLFAKHDQRLFSANYRGFLGISKRRKINNAIRDSAERAEEDFWVYNNGVTLLTLNIDYEKNNKLVLNGISIINGAQTTGSIGSVDISKHELKGVQVLCRIIRCDDPDKISSIVKYNNTQNAITTWDQYSGDVEQTRIESEFSDLEHHYSKKRGFRTNNNLDQIGIEDVAQPLVSFKGQYGNANAGKNNIFGNAHLYKLAFEGKKARHILLIHCLAKAIDERRIELKNKSSLNQLIEMEEQQLSLLRNLRFKYFFMSLMPKLLEPIVGWKVDSDTIAFNPVAAKSSNNSIISLVASCIPVVNIILTLVSTQVKADDLSELIQNDEAVHKLTQAVSGLLYATNVGNSVPEFKKLVSAT